MVNFCLVANCSNSSRNRPDLSFFCFPSGHFRRLWKNFCRRCDPEFQNQKNPRICSAHFEASSIKKSLCGRKEVIPGELPKYFNPSTHQCRVSSREKRLEDRKRRAVDEKCPEPQKRSLTEEDNDICFLSDDAALLDHNYCHLLPNDKGTQTDFPYEDLEVLTSKIDALKQENAELKSKLSNKKQLKRELFVDDVLKDDESVKFFTGIPSLACFMMIFNLLKPFAEKLKYWDKNKEKKVSYQKDSSKKKPGKQRLLTIMEEFILTLVRLRLGLLSRHLTDIFGVSEGSVSKVFTTWICFLSTVFRDILLKWPCKEEIKKKLPSSFNKFPSTRIIIDCTEIFLQKPTSPSAQRATWSNYKQHNTMKALVGITPTGYFSFVSKLWTGNVSDRYITERSGLLDKLEEGDSVMADKGFNIRDLLTRKKVALNIPPLCKGTFPIKGANGVGVEEGMLR